MWNKINFKNIIEYLRHTGLRSEESDYMCGVDRIIKAPLPATSQLLIMSFLLLFILVLLWGVFSKVDIVSTAQGKSVTSSRIQLIQSPQLAIVERIFVKEGQHVMKGQLLVKLDRKQLDSQQRDAYAKVSQFKAKRQRIRALISAAKQKIAPVYPLEADSPEEIRESHLMLDSWATYRSKLASNTNHHDGRLAVVNRIKADINRLNKLIPFSRKKVRRNQQLYKKGGINLNELELSKESLIDRQSSLKVFKQELNEALAELSQSSHDVNAFTEQFINNLSLEMVDVEQTLLSAEEESIRASVQINQFNLSAPVAGIVKDIMVNTEGGVVQPAEILMQIIPENVPLEVEAKILNRDIGFVHQGQNVKVKVDTFNFTKYGAIEGIIKHLAQDTTEDEELGPVYLALVELERDTVKVGERTARLVPGMTMAVDIYVGQRRIIEYILNPVLRYQDEVMRER
jgi:hemolysin D